MSAEKMRVSYRCSRQGSAKHNVHDHIETERRNVVVYDAMKNGPGTLEEKEIRFYEQLLGPGIEERNARYRAERHPEKCRTAEEIYRNKNTRPEEFILQIGNKNQSADRTTFEICVKDFSRKLNSWNRAHEMPFRFLDGCFHFDETTDHYQGRRIWGYKDEKGFFRLGQEEALKRAGVELPKPDQPVSQRNNRKITFDKMCREMWQEVCKAHGLDIETKPLPSRRHKETEEYIDYQIENKVLRLEELEVQICKMEESATARLDAIREAQRSAEIEATMSERKAQEASQRAAEAHRAALDAEEQAYRASIQTQKEEGCYLNQVKKNEEASREQKRLADEIAVLQKDKRNVMQELADIKAELERARAERAAKNQAAYDKARQLERELGFKC